MSWLGMVLFIAYSAALGGVGFVVGWFKGGDDAVRQMRRDNTALGKMPDEDRALPRGGLEL